MDAPTVALVPWPQVPLPLAGARECQGEKPTQERGNLAWGGGLARGLEALVTVLQSLCSKAQRDMVKGMFLKKSKKYCRI